MGTVGIIVIVVAAVLLAAAFVHGFFRRMTRVSWIGWQILLLFACSFLLDLFEPDEKSDLYFWIVLGAFAGLLAAVYLVSSLLRKLLYAHLRPKQKGGFVICGRIFGGITCAVNLVVFFAVFGGAALVVLEALPFSVGLEDFFANDIWQFLSGHVYDLFIISVCFVFVRAGLRLGVLRGIYYLLMFALTFAAFVGAYLLATQVAVFEGWGAGLAEKFSSLSPAQATVLGHGIIALAWFALLFAAVMGVGALLHWGIRKSLNCAPVGIVSSVLLGILFFAVFIAVACAFNYGAAYLVHELAHQYEFLNEMMIADTLESILISSPLSRAFYLYNPFASLLGI